MNRSRTLVPLIFALTLLLSISLSPWWNPWNYSLSALGSASNGLGGAVFNGGLALTSWELEKGSSSDLLLLIALGIGLVAAINIDFGLAHFIVSVLLFLLLYAYVLSNASIEGYVGTALSIGLWISHFLYGVPPGVAIPELSAIALALYYYVTRP
ncbi:hypothetical protein EYM_02565 [Ignicoccus islandicus DSM 13165]|uniref:Uncharacterized protein n=1 Tax=Ignicoccus islandicus DSM 13165 TaxID=940295 RepID=A0A0U2WN05_9CREN|nr:hypothetical protein [Ignicoccus islandicus]ALU12337.1 hypothetical protein EYM_02565 [Ignicoccus islandicus DSM 13165]